MSVAGFGFRAGAGVESLADALALAAARAPDAEPVVRLAAPEDKAGAPCLRGLARRLALDVAGVSPGAIAAASVLTRSPRTLALRGTGSVAEAAALAGAGEGATLLGPRSVSGDRLATCALAIGPRLPRTSS